MTRERIRRALRAGAAVRKDAQILLRDRSALTSLFLLPIVFMGVFGRCSRAARRRRAASRGGLRPRDNPRAAAAVDAIAGSGLFRVREETTGRLSSAWWPTTRWRRASSRPLRSDGRCAGRAGHRSGASPAVRGPSKEPVGLIGRSMFGGPLRRCWWPRARPASVERWPAPPRFSSSCRATPSCSASSSPSPSASPHRGAQVGHLSPLLAAPVRRTSLLLAKLVPF